MSNLIDDFKQGEQLIKNVDANTVKEGSALDLSLKKLRTNSNTINSQQQSTDNAQLNRIFTSEPTPNSGSRQAQTAAGDNFSSSDLSSMDDLDPSGGGQLYKPINHDLIDQYQENQVKVNQNYNQALQNVPASVSGQPSVPIPGQIMGDEFDFGRGKFGQFGEGWLGGAFYGLNQLALPLYGAYDTIRTAKRVAEGSVDALGAVVGGGLDVLTGAHNKSIGQNLQAWKERVDDSLYRFANSYSDSTSTPLVIQSLMGRDLSAYGITGAGNTNDDYNRVFGASPVAKIFEDIAYIGIDDKTREAYKANTEQINALSQQKLWNSLNPYATQESKNKLEGQYQDALNKRDAFVGGLPQRESLRQIAALTYDLFANFSVFDVAHLNGKSKNVKIPTNQVPPENVLRNITEHPSGVHSAVSDFSQTIDAVASRVDDTPVSGGMIDDLINAPLVEDSLRLRIDDYKNSRSGLPADPSLEQYAQRVAQLNKQYGDLLDIASTQHKRLLDLKYGEFPSIAPALDELNTRITKYADYQTSALNEITAQSNTNVKGIVDNSAVQKASEAYRALEADYNNILDKIKKLVGAEVEQKVFTPSAEVHVLPDPWETPNSSLSQLKTPVKFNEPTGQKLLPGGVDEITQEQARGVQESIHSYTLRPYNEFNDASLSVGRELAKQDPTLGKIWEDAQLGNTSWDKFMHSEESFKAVQNIKVTNELVDNVYNSLERMFPPEVSFYAHESITLDDMMASIGMATEKTIQDIHTFIAKHGITDFYEAHGVGTRDKDWIIIDNVGDAVKVSDELEDAYLPGSRIAVAVCDSECAATVQEPETWKVYEVGKGFIDGTGDIPRARAHVPVIPEKIETQQAPTITNPWDEELAPASRLPENGRQRDFVPQQRLLTGGEGTSTHTPQPVNIDDGLNLLREVQPILTENSLSKHLVGSILGDAKSDAALLKYKKKVGDNRFAVRAEQNLAIAWSKFTPEIRQKFVDNIDSKFGVPVNADHSTRWLWLTMTPAEAAKAREWVVQNNVSEVYTRHGQGSRGGADWSEAVKDGKPFQSTINETYPEGTRVGVIACAKECKAFINNPETYHVLVSEGVQDVPKVVKAQEMTTPVKEYPDYGNTYYHGTNADDFSYERVDTNQSTRGSNTLGRGFYLTPFEGTAQSYGTSVSQFSVDKSKLLTFDYQYQFYVWLDENFPKRNKKDLIIADTEIPQLVKSKGYAGVEILKPRKGDGSIPQVVIYDKEAASPKTKQPTVEQPAPKQNVIVPSDPDPIVTIEEPVQTLHKPIAEELAKPRQVIKADRVEVEETPVKAPQADDDISDIIKALEDDVELTPEQTQRYMEQMRKDDAARELHKSVSQAMAEYNNVPGQKRIEGVESQRGYTYTPNEQAVRDARNEAITKREQAAYQYVNNWLQETGQQMADVRPSTIKSVVAEFAQQNPLPVINSIIDGVPSDVRAFNDADLVKSSDAQTVNEQPSKQPQTPDPTNARPQADNSIPAIDAPGDIMFQKHGGDNQAVMRERVHSIKPGVDPVEWNRTHIQQLVDEFQKDIDVNGVVDEATWEKVYVSEGQVIKTLGETAPEFPYYIAAWDVFSFARPGFGGETRNQAWLDAFKKKHLDPLITSEAPLETTAPVKQPEPTNVETPVHYPLDDAESGSEFLSIAKSMTTEDLTNWMRANDWEDAQIDEVIKDGILDEKALSKVVYDGYFEPDEVPVKQPEPANTPKTSVNIKALTATPIKKVLDIIAAASNVPSGVKVKVGGRLTDISKTVRSASDIVRLGSLIPHPDNPHIPLIPVNSKVAKEFKARYGVDHPFANTKDTRSKRIMQKINKNGGVSITSMYEELAGRPETQFYAELLNPNGRGIPTDIVEQLEQSAATHGELRFKVDTKGTVATVFTPMKTLEEGANVSAVASGVISDTGYDAVASLLDATDLNKLESEVTRAKAFGAFDKIASDVYVLLKGSLVFPEKEVLLDMAANYLDDIYELEDLAANIAEKTKMKKQVDALLVAKSEEPLSELYGKLHKELGEDYAQVSELADKLIKYEYTIEKLKKQKRFIGATVEDKVQNAIKNKELPKAGGNCI